MDDGLRQRLIAMRDEDRRARTRLAESGAPFDGYHPDMQAVHDANAEALADVVARIGWPDAAAVGEDGADAAWTIVQHAVAKPDFLRFCLGLMRQAASEGRIPLHHPAMLEDRILFLEGRPQVYGSALDWDPRGVLGPTAIEDAERVDERRAAVGLPPLAETVAALRARAKRDGETPPGDPQARQRAFEAWAKRVGWR